MNLSELAAKLAPLVGLNLARWVDWTPTVTQGAAVTVTVTEAKYCVIGKVAHFYAKVALTSAGTAGQYIVIGGIPAAAAMAATAYYSVGHFVAYDAAPSALFYAGVLRSNNNASALIMNTDGGTGALGINPAWTVANGDSLNISGTYRVA